MSGSMDPKVRQPKTQNMLGFQPGRFQDVSLPIDCQDLIYGACILKHSIHGLDFPDLAWPISDDLTSPDDIQPTLIAVSMITIADTLVKWLHTQLQAFMTHECGLVFPFHSLILQEDHIRMLLELEQGLIHIVVATTASNLV